MYIQSFLTYFINFVALSSILLFLLDFSLFLASSWQQLNPATQPDFYRQVKDLLWDLDTPLAASAN